MALAGAVVSNPTAKNTTSRSGFPGELHGVQGRVDDPHVAAGGLDGEEVAFRLPGTRSMSPKEQKITSGRAAISMALSISSSGVTRGFEG
jgi:hypothetical protein